MKATESDPPRLHRAFFSKAALKQYKIRKDPESVHGLRTAQTIPKGYALQATTSPVEESLASEAFKHEFNNDVKNRRRLRIDTVITSGQAALMLREQQTPSPTDTFPPIGWGLSNPAPQVQSQAQTPLPVLDWRPPTPEEHPVIDLDEYFGK